VDSLSCSIIKILYNSAYRRHSSANGLSYAARWGMREHGSTDEARRQVLAHLPMLGREMGEVSRTVSRSLGLHDTQLRAIDHVLRAGQLSPSELSHRLGISTGSTTSLIDGLERMGHVRRLPHPSDRRRIILKPTDRARREGRQAFRPLGDRLAQLVDSCTAEELIVIECFLRQLREEIRIYGAEVVESLGPGDGHRPSQ
jgi:DNA-binding MarR family transcriptional regulator